MHKYDWIVIGSGIAGITIAEVMSREGYSVLVLERNKQFASETTKVFHEWLHTGSLYTLLPDGLLTMRYLLGAIDDLFEYYSSFHSMNLQPTQSGFIINSPGWFNSENIHFRYKNRKLNPAWLSIVSRSQCVLEMIKEHDWLRRRAGSCYGPSKVKYSSRFKKILPLLANKGLFTDVISPDITMNSRVILHDLFSACVNRGVSFINKCEALSLSESRHSVTVKTSRGKFYCSNVISAAPDFNSNVFNLPIKESYAPIAVVENVPRDTPSFVELDYFTKTCINLIKKPGGIAQAGGISVSTIKKSDEYIKYVIDEHKKRTPNIKVAGIYTGLKKELVLPNQNRNYLYHTIQHTKNIWSVVLGKFTLAFSLAPEFYRQVYHKNPTKNTHDNVKITDKPDSFSFNDLIAKTSWQEVIDEKVLEKEVS